LGRRGENNARKWFKNEKNARKNHYLATDVIKDICASWGGKGGEGDEGGKRVYFRKGQNRKRGKRFVRCYGKGITRPIAKKQKGIKRGWGEFPKKAEATSCDGRPRALSKEGRSL